jgi:hypothetical protein
MLLSKTEAGHRCYGPASERLNPVEDIDMIKHTAWGAIALGFGLLALQILAAYESTLGGSAHSQWAAMGAMVAVFALPVAIEGAWRNGLRGVSVALGVGFLGFLIYSLPATTGRVGEAKAVKVTAAGDVAKMRDDLERTTKMLDWARQDWMTECGTGEGKKCRAKRNTVQALEDRANKLQGELGAARTDSVGDQSSAVWAWALSPIGATEGGIRNSTTLAYAVGIDFAIFALVWFWASVILFPKAETVSLKPAANDTAQTSFPVPPNGGNRRPAYTRAAAEADVIQLVGRGQPIPTQDTLAERWGVTKGCVSKWLRRFEAEGLISRETVGRCKMVAAA